MTIIRITKWSDLTGLKEDVNARNKLTGALPDFVPPGVTGTEVQPVELPRGNLRQPAELPMGNIQQPAELPEGNLQQPAGLLTVNVQKEGALVGNGKTVDVVAVSQEVAGVAGSAWSPPGGEISGGGDCSSRTGGVVGVGGATLPAVCFAHWRKVDKGEGGKEREETETETET